MRQARARNATLFPRLTNPGFLAQAWRSVLAHYAAGKVPPALAEFERRRGSRLEILAENLRKETFLPQPASLIYVPKPNQPEEQRPIALLVPEDRIVLTALNTLIGPLLDRQLLPGCFAYRTGLGASAAVEAVHSWIQTGHVHIATGDLDEFFATIDRGRLQQLLRRRIWETPVINLLEAYLHIGVVRDLEWRDDGRGIAQGSPLSPVLANFYLADLDHLLEQKRLPWARYADNILILGKEPTPVLAAWEEGRQYLESVCRLRFNPGSCKVTTADDGFEFLGFWFKGLTRTMSAAKLDAKRLAIAAALRANTNDLKKLVADLSESMAGWRRYYGRVPETQPQLEMLERHLEDLLVPWLSKYRAQPAAAGRSAAELKAQIMAFDLPATTEPRRKIKWAELVLSRSRPQRTADDKGVSPLAARAIRARKKELEERRQLLEEILITRPGTYLGRTGERLLIRHDGKREAEVPLSLVRSISFLTTGVSLSGELMAEAASRGIPILIAGPDGRAAVRIGALDLPGHEISLAQSSLAMSPEGLELARTIVRGKIRNQINLLQYFLKYPERRGGEKFLPEATRAIREMEQVFTELGHRQFSADHDLERNRLFAAEGQAALSYWAAARALLWYKPNFDKRIHRGASDLVNSLLNYGYGILYSRLWVVLIKAGLNVNVGFLHKPQPGKAGLLYDFIEEFRTGAVDRTVFSMLNLASDLKTGEHGLEQETRHLLARRVAERLQGKVRYHGESLPLLRIMELQADLLVRHVQRKDTYQSFILPW